jgi:hypothetical protein
MPSRCPSETVSRNTVGDKALRKTKIILVNPPLILNMFNFSQRLALSSVKGNEAPGTTLAPICQARVVMHIKLSSSGMANPWRCQRYTPSVLEDSVTIHALFIVPVPNFRVGRTVCAKGREIRVRGCEEEI